MSAHRGRHCRRFGFDVDKEGNKGNHNLVRFIYLPADVRNSDTLETAWRFMREEKITSPFPTLYKHCIELDLFKTF